MQSRPKPLSETLLFFTIASIFGGLLSLTTADGAELLRYRLAKAKAVHVKDEATAKSYEKSLKKLGVTSKINGHQGHYDLNIQCPQWLEAEFNSHAEVDKWSKWLSSLGFETKHEH